MNMKAIAVALAVTAVCVALVSGNAIALESPAQPMEYIPQTSAESVVDVDNFWIFGSFFWIARAALRTLKGLNCTIKQVVIIRTEATNFVDNIQGCGTEAANSFKKVITSAQAVIATSNKIINLNEQVCNKDHSTDESKSTTWKCFLKLLGQLNTLNKQIKNTLAAIKKVPEVPADAKACTTQSVQQLTSVFTSFPSNVNTCSKLTSK